MALASTALRAPASKPVDVAPAQTAATAEIRSRYLEAIQLVERVHRRLLDVVKDEFDRRGRDDVNAVQALLLFNVGDAELTAGELRTRGFYMGSNVSYNLKKLVDLGYMNHQRSRIDRRAVRVSLTPKGQEIADVVASLYDRHVASIDKVGGLSVDEFAALNKSLLRLDRFWNDTILYRL
ncbi:MAG: winged helix DNA-binding protein [Rhizobiaceae bacterium]|jgi:DNA-binding MarR family transcriptional regulator|nr:winged helix DNA-binding protein [Rhizobiaceae bacterium]